MNRQILSLMTAAMVLMAAFASCEKDKSGGDDNGGGGDNNPLVINVRVVDGMDYNDRIATVKAVTYDLNGHEYVVLASGEYAYGEFTLSLPGTFPEKCLYGIDILYSGVAGTVSDPKAKMGWLMLFAYNNNGKMIGEFWWKNDEGHCWANYRYSDRNFTIKGHDSHDAEYDCSFTKGWNIEYEIEKGVDFEDLLYTTKRPSGANLNWYYDDRE